TLCFINLPRPTSIRLIPYTTLFRSLAPWLHQDHRAMIRHPDRFHGLDHRLWFHHHPRTAAERHIVDLSMAVAGVRAKIVRMQLDQATLNGAGDHSLLKHRAEHAWKDRDDVESHSCLSFA